MGKVVLSSKEATWAPAPSLHLAAHHSASPQAAGPAPWHAPGSHLWHTELTSLPTFSKLCPHVCHFTTSEPRSLVSSSLPGSSVDGIFQARVLEWVAISFSMRHPK